MSTTETTLGGRYRIGPLIAQGGMGTVYRGSDDVLGRDVAIKILDDELAGNPEFIERFRREARNAALPCTRTSPGSSTTATTTGAGTS
jgi:serine/threonine protein kinase